MPKLSRFSLLAILLFVLVPLVGAQGAGSVITNYVFLDHNGDQSSPQNVEIYFTMTDSNGTIITEPPSQTTITFTAGNITQNVTPTIEPANSPLFITLVLDASGSMQGAAPVMRDAAVAAVNAAPVNAQFAVLAFNNDINIVQGFTDDRNLIQQAIRSVTPNPQGGTCLYDAALRSVELLQQSVSDPTARRASIVFTDGRDELRAGGGTDDKCSESEIPDVTGAATTPRLRVPIYTIGMQGGAPVAVNELEQIALTTGGIAVTGSQADLQTLFLDVMQALNSQWVARAQTCFPPGPVSALLNVSVNNDTLNPAPLTFQIADNQLCFVPPTPTPTSTPSELVLGVGSFAFDDANEQASFEVQRDGGSDDVAQYRVQIFNADTNSRIEEFRVSAEGTRLQEVTFDTTEYPNLDIAVVIDAEDVNGGLLARSDEASFRLQRAGTPTPIPTETPIPVDVEIVSLQLNEQTSIAQLGLAISRPERVADIAIDFIDADTSTQALSFTPELADSYELDLSDLVPRQSYIIRATINTDTGERIANEFEFVYQPLETPTPTPSPTQIPVNVLIDRVSYDAANDLINVALILEAPERVIDFRVDLIETDTSLVVGSYSPTLAENLTLSTADLQAGIDYTIRLVVQSSTGRLTPEEPFTYDPPRTPTPTPQPTATPTPIPAINIAGIRLNDDEATVELDVVNPSPIGSYEIRLNNAGGVQVGNNITVNVPPYDSFTFSLDSLNAIPGEYQLILRVIDQNGNLISTAEPAEFVYNPPPPPTATPQPGLPERLANSARDNPIVAGIIFLAFMLLLGLLFFLFRQGRRQANPQTVSNPGYTQIISSSDVQSASSGTPAPGGAGSNPGQPSGVAAPPPIAGGYTGDETIIEETGEDPTMVDSVAEATLPPGVNAFLYITRSDDASKVQQRVEITSGMFSIGRKNARLTINDQRISRTHALITFENGQFSITDVSSSGTWVNGNKIEPNQSFVLQNGATIRLGTATDMQFLTEEPTTNMPAIQPSDFQ